MAYQYNIPLATDQLSTSQNDINQNFIALGVIAGNTQAASASLNNVSGFNFINLPAQGAKPPVVFPAGNIGLYSSVNAITGQNEFYINKSVAGPLVKQIPATASILSVTPAPASPSNGWTYLPSGILIKWGSVSVARNTLTLAAFPVGANIPAFTVVFSMTATQSFAAGPTLGDLNTAPCIGNFSAINFQVYPRSNGTPNTGNVTINYIAFGISA